MSNLEQHGKFRNYSEIFTNIAKFRYVAKLCMDCPLIKDKIVHSVFFFFLNF